MGNLHRIQWIDQRIRAGQYPNCTAIASQFEISVRQAARDIEYLRDSLGAPVVYSASHNGYVYDGPDFRLPQLALSTEDKDTLRSLSVQYARSGSQNARRLAALFQKLSGSGDMSGRNMPGGTACPDPVPPDGDDPVLLIYRQLDLAWQLRRKAILTYVDARHRTTRRTVRPYLLFMKGQTPYLTAHCELRRQVRTFSLARIQQVDTLRTGYVIPEDFRPEDYRSNGEHGNRQPYEAVVLFPETTRVQAYPHQARPLPDGSLVLSFHHAGSFLSWLLAHPPGYRLTSPSWLRDRLVDQLRTLLRDHLPT